MHVSILEQLIFRANACEKGKKMSQAKGSIVQQTISKTKFQRFGLGLALSVMGTQWAWAEGSGTEDVFNVPNRPTLNFYGSAGLIDMPTAEALPDGQFVIGVSSFAGGTRTTLTFQATPRLSASFRYVGIKDASFSSFDTYRARSFDIRYLLKKEGRIWPAITVGLQDFAGTGIYAGEYIVATKTFDGGARIPGTVKVTAGLGWGRLGSSGAIGTPFGGTRPAFQSGSTGGDQWFRGEAAPFAGVEWQINDKWGVKAEYSSDAYTVEGILSEAMKPQFKANGLELVALQVSASQAELRYRNLRYPTASVAIGRAARVMAQMLPPSVETFRIVTMSNNLAQSAVTIRRSDLEALEYDPQAADALLAVTGIGEAAPTLDNAVTNDDLFPDFAWSIGPYLSNSYFDPDEPVRVDGGLKFTSTYRPAPGWEISGALTHRLFGNIGDSERFGNSALQAVRTDSVLYARSDTVLSNLYVSKQWKPGDNTYARVTAGYLERMFGGVSAELLWKPVGSRLALGVEGNYVKQRAFSGLGFQDGAGWPSQGA